MFKQIKEKYSKKLEYFSHKGLNFPKLISNTSKKYFEVGNIFLRHFSDDDKTLFMLCAAFDLRDAVYEVSCVDIETGINLYGSLNKATLITPEWKQFIEGKTFHRKLVVSRCGNHVIFVAKNLKDLLKQS